MNGYCTVCGAWELLTHLGDLQLCVCPACAKRDPRDLVPERPMLRNEDGSVDWTHPENYDDENWEDL